MALRVLIARRLVVAGWLASAVLAACTSAFGDAQAANPPAAPPSQDPQGQSLPQSQQDDGYSSSVHHKSNSGQNVHHTTVAEEVAPPPELTHAENLIDKHAYAGAEPLLRKVVGDDPANYVAWFDLGFVENALGKVDDSIAAYRKAVAAKPDVFESNLNLGLQLAKTGQPDAEEYLRAATHLKPSSQPAEGQYRAWLSLAETIQKSKREEALVAYQHAATLQPKEAEPHLSAGQVFERENKFADAEQEYKRALALDARSTDAVIGLANLYMRGRRFPDAEDSLRKLLAVHAESAP